MSKVWKDFEKYIISQNLLPRFFKSHNPGQRILPANTKKENQQHQLRVDAGETYDGYKNLYLQANSEAKNTALKEYISKNGTHSNLATVRIKADTPVDKQSEAGKQALADMGAQFRSKVG